MFRSSSLFLYPDTCCLPRLAALKSTNRRGWTRSTKSTDTKQWLLFCGSPQTQRAKPRLSSQQHQVQAKDPTTLQLTKRKEVLHSLKSWLNASSLPALPTFPQKEGSWKSGGENSKVISCYKYLKVIVLLVWVVRGCKKIQGRRGELNWERGVTIKSPFKRFAQEKKAGGGVCVWNNEIVTASFLFYFKKSLFFLIWTMMMMTNLATLQIIPRNPFFSSRPFMT